MSSAVQPTPAAYPGVDHPSFVPGLLLADALSPGASDRPVRRSVRDWIVDAALFLTALGLGFLLFAEAADRPDAPSDGVLFADLLLGTIACVALWVRRRWPVGLCLAMAPIGAFSEMVAIAVLIALFTVAVHRTWRLVLLVTAAHIPSLLAYIYIRPDPELPAPVLGALGVVLTAAVLAWGMFVRARRQLVVSLRDRAVRAENEQRLRVDQAQQLERTRIAREMHDVLAHRLSLLSMHAGALEFRPDATPAEVAQAAGVIRASARGALEDLREVIGVLRDTGDGELADRPQPTLADLAALVDQSRDAGLHVRLSCSVPDGATVPALTGRTVYRVVQEALTNVRKHAWGAVATVHVTARPGNGVEVEVTNPARIGTEPGAPLPGSGTGLIGLQERVGLAGGRLEHGWTADGEFRLHAWLPWPEAQG